MRDCGKPLGGKIAFVCIVAGLSVALTACAPIQGTADGQDRSSQDSGSETPAVQVSLGLDSDCSMCHTVESASMDGIRCDFEGRENSQCTVCHFGSDEVEMQTVHENASASEDMPSKLRSTKVENELCLECHYGTNEALVAATGDIPSVTDKNGLSVNPHAQALGSESHEVLECSYCHDVHQSADVQKNAEETCNSCHHQGVFECNTCHA